MAANYQENLHKISQFLELSSQPTPIQAALEEKFDDLNDRTTISTIICDFLNYFEMFRALKAMLNEVANVVVASFDICEGAEDLADLLVKSILLRIVEIYIDHSPFADKEKILKTLSQSLEILAPSALIINLGLLAKPVFSDPEYLKKQEQADQQFVEKIDTSAIATSIKAQIDQWIKQQELIPDQQLELQAALTQEMELLASQQGLANDSSEYKQIFLEATEMLNMQLTALSLIMDLGDEDLSPQPINL